MQMQQAKREGVKEFMEHMRDQGQEGSQPASIEQQASKLVLKDERKQPDIR